MSKKLVFESIANVMEWLFAVAIFAFLASVFIPYASGQEASQATVFMWGLLLERAFVAFAFVYNRMHALSPPIAGG